MNTTMYEDYKRWCGVISIHFFFGFFPKSKLNAQMPNAKLIRKTKKKKGEKKTGKHLFV